MSADDALMKLSIAVSLGEAIKAARGAKSMNQLGRESGIPVGQLSLIESGKRADPQFSTMIKVARALGVSLDSLAESAPRKVASPLEQRLHDVEEQLRALTPKRDGMSSESAPLEARLKRIERALKRITWTDTPIELDHLRINYEHNAAEIHEDELTAKDFENAISYEDPSGIVAAKGIRVAIPAKRSIPERIAKLEQRIGDIDPGTTYFGEDADASESLVKGSISRFMEKVTWSLGAGELDSGGGQLIKNVNNLDNALGFTQEYLLMLKRLAMAVAEGSGAAKDPRVSRILQELEALEKDDQPRPKRQAP